jgi:hypothetical protein
MVSSGCRGDAESPHAGDDAGLAEGLAGRDAEMPLVPFTSYAGEGDGGPGNRIALEYPKAGSVFET